MSIYIDTVKLNSTPYTVKVDYMYLSPKGKVGGSNRTITCTMRGFCFAPVSHFSSLNVHV